MYRIVMSIAVLVVFIFLGLSKLENATAPPASAPVSTDEPNMKGLQIPER